MLQFCLNLTKNILTKTSEIRPRGEMVDTKDLKSLPARECQFESGRGHQI